MLCGSPTPEKSGLSVHPDAISGKEIAAITCQVARLATLLCNVFEVNAGDPGVAAGATPADEPYIWDIPQGD